MTLRLSNDYTIHNCGCLLQIDANSLEQYNDDNDNDSQIQYNSRMSSIKNSNLDIFDPTTVHIVSGYIRNIETNLLKLYNGKTFYNIPLNVAHVCLQYVKDVDIMKFDGMFDYEDESLSDTEINGPNMIQNPLTFRTIQHPPNHHNNKNNPKIHNHSYPEINASPPPLIFEQESISPTYSYLHYISNTNSPSPHFQALELDEGDDTQSVHMS